MAATAESNEELQLSVETLLITLDLHNLLEIAKLVGISDTTYKNKSRMQLVKILRKSLDENADDLDEQKRAPVTQETPLGPLEATMSPLELVDQPVF